MNALLLLALAASAQTAGASNIAGKYVAVTETEYEITLTLESKGRAQYEFVTWEADDPAPRHHEKLSGKWSRSGNTLIVQLSSGKAAIYSIVPCLSYQEFEEANCSPGLSLVNTTLADRYGLKRFGLWNTSSLRFSVRP
jgi:hypothetical protein